MKKLLLLLLLSLGFVGTSYAHDEIIDRQAILLAAQEAIEREIAEFEAELAAESAAYQQRLLDIEATCGSYSFDLQVASVERLEVERKTLIKHLEVEKKTLIKQLEVERKTLIKQLEELRIENYKNLSEINDVKLDIYLLSVEIDEAVKSEPGLNSSVQSLEDLQEDLYFRGIVCSRKTAKLEAELAAQEMMAEIEAEQAALEDFAQKLIDEKVVGDPSPTKYLKKLWVEDIAAKVISVWNFPGAKDGWFVEVLVTQNKEGEVMNVKFGEDNVGNSVIAQRFIDSVERAVYKAIPLPIAPDISVWEKDIMFTFYAD